MKKSIAALLLTTTLAPLAHAQQAHPYYAGLSLTSHGRASGISRTGERVWDDGRNGIKAYAGFNLNPVLAFEAGYADYGDYVLKNTGPGTSGDATLDARMFYLAAKGTHMFTERFGVFGKLGVAYARFGQHGLDRPDVTMTRPMFGAGLQYDITKHVALTLELNHYGKKELSPSRRFVLNKLEAGVKFSF